MARVYEGTLFRTSCQHESVRLKLRAFRATILLRFKQIWLRYYLKQVLHEGPYILIMRSLRVGIVQKITERKNTACGPPQESELQEMLRSSLF